MNELVRTSKVPLSQQLKKILQEEIDAGLFQPGSRILSERELCERFGVSRMTVRSAISELAHEGYVEKIMGSGTYVCHKDRSYPGNGEGRLTGNIGFIRCRHSSTRHSIRNDYIYFEILEGIQNELMKNEDVHIIFNYLHETDQRIENLMNQLSEKTDGLIIGNLRTPEFLQLIKKLPIPFVLVNPTTHFIDVDTVDVDNQIIGVKAVNYLAALGHRRIAFINGSEKSSHAAGRLQGYMEALRLNGIPFDQSICIHAYSWHEEAGAEAMADILRNDKEITAVFAANDTLARGAIDALKDNNLSVPGDISVMGCDDMVISDNLRPPLTTLSFDRFEMGRTAARKIHNHIHNKEYQATKVLFLPTIISRDSCRRIAG